MKRIVIVILMAALMTMCFTGVTQAGTLTELEDGLHHYDTIGEIVDPDIKLTLYELLDKAKAAGGDLESENAYRDAIIDVVNAFRDVGISIAAADHLVQLAQP